MLTIYGYRLSSCTKRVALILHEKAVQFTLVEVQPQDFKSPEHLKRQPFGQIPVMNDDGYVIYESRAIARYINAKHAAQGTPGLAPSTDNVQRLGEFEMACSIEYSQFSPIVDRLMKEVIFKKMKGLDVDATVEKTLTTGLEQKLDVYNEILKNQPYLAGKDVSLADLFHLPECELIFNHSYPEMVRTRAHVARWWLELSRRESWLAVKDGVKSW